MSDIADKTSTPAEASKSMPSIKQTSSEIKSRSDSDEKIEERKYVALPVDHSEHSFRAFAYYKKFLHKPEFTVLIIHIHTLPNVSITHQEGQVQISGQWKQKLQENINSVKALLEKYSKLCTDSGMQFKLVSHIKRDSVGADINRIVSQHGAFWIVMGRRGMNIIRRTLMGSVSDYLLFNSRVTMTLVPSDFLDNPDIPDETVVPTKSQTESKQADVDPSETKIEPQTTPIEQSAS